MGLSVSMGDSSVTNEDAINELLKRGISHHEADEVVEARNIYVEILERDPQNHRALDLAGLLCMQCLSLIHI